MYNTIQQYSFKNFIHFKTNHILIKKKFWEKNNSKKEAFYLTKNMAKLKKYPEFCTFLNIIEHSRTFLNIRQHSRTF